MQKSKLRGIPRNELRARIAIKRAKKLWHFGPKNGDYTSKTEPVDTIVRKLRFG
jgi:hypothetical protein